MESWNLGDLFEGVADAVPGRDAVVSDRARLTYRDLDERANRLAHVLADAGVGPDDHVGLVLRNGHEYLEAMLAAFKLRAVPINVNTRYTTDFYAFRQQVEEAVRGIKALQSQGLLDDAKEMADSHRPELALRHLVEGTAAALTKLNQRERLAGYSTTMTAEQKRAELDRIIEMRNELTRRVMLRVPAVTRALQGLSADGGERSSLLQWAQP